MRDLSRDTTSYSGKFSTYQLWSPYHWRFHEQLQPTHLEGKRCFWVGYKHWTRKIPEISRI